MKSPGWSISMRSNKPESLEITDWDKEKDPQTSLDSDHLGQQTQDRRACSPAVHRGMGQGQHMPKSGNFILSSLPRGSEGGQSQVQDQKVPWWAMVLTNFDQRHRFGPEFGKES